MEATRRDPVIPTQTALLCEIVWRSAPTGVLTALSGLGVADIFVASARKLFSQLH
jgi:hypothetical protein